MTGIDPQIMWDRLRGGPVIHPWTPARSSKICLWIKPDHPLVKV